VVIAESAGRGYAISDAASGEDLGEVGRRDVTRVGVNNQLRSALRAQLARLRLEDGDPRRRVAAIAAVGGSGDVSMIPTLSRMLKEEGNGDVVEALEEAIAVLELGSDDPAVRLA